MAATKRSLDDEASPRKAKRAKMTEDENTTPLIPSGEVDFPRGGGSSFTPLEVKSIRAEAVKEANEELFKDSQIKSNTKRKGRKSEGRHSTVASGSVEKPVRVEHLTYKRVTVGMKIFGQVVAIQPLALIVSLPNQLFAHVPITNISSQYTSRLEEMDQDSEQEDDDEEEHPASGTPDLSDMFAPGQYVRAVVTAVHEAGTTDAAGITKSRDQVSRASKRVELSLIPERVNAGVSKADLKPGFTISASVKSVEDHGYIIDLGVPDVTGFVSFKGAKKGSDVKLPVGRLIEATVLSASTNGRTINLGVDPASFSSALSSEVTSVTSVLPGTLVHGLITAVNPDGLNLQILGFFDATIDQFQLRVDATDKAYKVGKKVKARILYNYSSSPPRFALSLAEHVVGLGVKKVKVEGKGSTAIQESFPVGAILESVTTLRVEPERGVVVHVQPGLEAFIHISQLSDDHVPSLSPTSGSWKIGSTHRARVMGYYPLDGLLQLSMKKSILEQQYLKVGDVQVGEVVKGTIKQLNDTGLFVALSGNVDGVVWPNHFADIVLKHPSKRFKVGGSVKCRVLAVDLERKRISLTAKKSLLESTLPILSSIEDIKIGLVTHAVVFKVSDKHLMVEFFNNLKASVPAREASESASGKLSATFPVGRVVKVCITHFDRETAKITASIRQASANFKAAAADISGIEIGNHVEGAISEIHKDNAVVTLKPSQVRALISLNNLANSRSISLAQLRASLQVDQPLQDLIVVSRNTEKGLVIVANKPKPRADLLTKGTLAMDSVTIGQMVGGRVTRQTRNGTFVKLSARIGGYLHPTDTSDNYETGTTFPSIDSIIKAVVIGIDVQKSQLLLSTRHSRMYPDQDKRPEDKEVQSLSDLKVGDSVRGFVKTVAEHGLFVTLGRDIDARVQIRELFDEYIKDWKSRFKVNQVVKGRILAIDMDNKKVEMSFRTGDLLRKASTGLTLMDFNQGQKVDCTVKKVEDYGLFVEIIGTKVSGLCHKSQISDNKDADVSIALQNFREGDLVKAVILSVDLIKRRIAFGLKPSYFINDDSDEEHAGLLDLEPEGFGVVREDIAHSYVEHEASDGSEDEQENNPSFGEDLDEDDDGMQVDIDVEGNTFGSKPSVVKVITNATAALDLQEGFRWFASKGRADVDEDLSSSSSDEEKSAPKKRKRRKEIEHDLTAELHTKAPESNADFERLLLGSPNSSYLWVQYMSFQLQLSEIEKARETGHRALRTINFREEQEKLNVWIALLNLENVYGTEETLEDAFKDAVRHNDSKTVHLRVALIFEQSEKLDKTEEQYKRTVKKFGQSSKAWTLFGEYYLRHDLAEEARKLLPRSLQSLEKRKHLKTISKFAQLEYKLGDPERGKTIFEGIVDSHPKRWDLWSIYMDMEAGQGDIQNLRNLFDRVLALKITSHKAKSFFKKWLELERRIGDEEGATKVKEKAVEWTQRVMQSSET